MVKRRGISRIVFDLDGVVLEKSRFSTELRKRFGITPEMTAPFFGEPFHRCQSGVSDIESEVSVFLPRWGWNSTVESFLSFWFECDSVPQREVLRAITSLRRRGVLCYLATNQDRCRAEFLRRTLAIEAYFDATFYSAELGVRKPADEFFHLIERSLAVPPEEILFLDDSKENAEAAANRRWCARYIESAESLHSQLQVLADL